MQCCFTLNYDFKLCIENLEVNNFVNVIVRKTVMIRLGVQVAYRSHRSELSSDIELG